MLRDHRTDAQALGFELENDCLFIVPANSVGRVYKSGTSKCPGGTLFGLSPIQLAHNHENRLLGSLGLLFSTI
jgi:hypothetical protein